MPPIGQKRTNITDRPTAGNRPFTGARLRGRPSNAKLNNFLEFPTQGNRPNPRPESGSDFLQDRIPDPRYRSTPDRFDDPEKNGNNRVNRRSDRVGHRSDRVNNGVHCLDDRDRLKKNRVARYNEIDIANRGYGNRLDWRLRNPYWVRRNLTQPYRWATWGALTSWIGDNAAQPRHCNYGDNVHYEGDTVYCNGKATVSADEHTEQASEITTSVPAVDKGEVEWMPLSVFALTQDNESTGPDPTLFLQLSISKEGIISGSLRNTSNNSQQWVEGSVDKESLRAAWTIVNQNRLIIETGIQN